MIFSPVMLEGLERRGGRGIFADRILSEHSVCSFRLAVLQASLNNQVSLPRVRAIWTQLSELPEELFPFNAEAIARLDLDYRRRRGEVSS